MFRRGDPNEKHLKREKKYQKHHTKSNTQKEPSVKVKVHYLGLVKTYTNKAQDDITLKDDATLTELFEQLAADLGKPFSPEVYEPAQKEVKPTFMVLLNGIVIGQLDGLDTKLKNGDVMVIMPLVTGG
jgi:sulfur-carrier protein